MSADEITEESQAKTHEEWSKDQRKKQIHAELERIDKDSVRPVRVGEDERVAGLEEQAQALRNELNNL